MNIAIAGYALGDKAVAGNVAQELIIPYLNGRDSEDTLDIFIYLNSMGNVTYEEICKEFHVSMDDHTQIIHVTGFIIDLDLGKYHRINTLNTGGFYNWGIIHALEGRSELSEYFSGLKKVEALN